MMDSLITQRVTPLLKCMVLFLFIFTAKVLTSRPQESQEMKNDLHQLKSNHYVRTFTKYHHRRTIQWNNNIQDQNDWPLHQDQPRVIAKRSIDFLNPNNQDWPERIDSEQPISKRDVEIPNLSLFVGSPKDILNSNQLSNDAASSKEDSRNKLIEDSKKYKVKAAVVFTEPPPVLGPRISCLYKMQSVALSVTPNYHDDDNEQMMVENESFDSPATLSETTLQNGETVQVEECGDPKASCYTLWHQDSAGNITVLGQGCWSSAQKQCDKCTRVTPILRGTKFCCCTKTLCNVDFTSLKEEIVTPKAESTIYTAPLQSNYTNLVAATILSLVAILVMAVVLRKLYCKPQTEKDDISDGSDIEKGDLQRSSSDTLATGLHCFDNLTLIELIGQGKFGSVWRGNLGSNPVAVKLYSNTSTWQKEAAVYSQPYLSHVNILKYYGSESRPSLTFRGPSSYIVLELCECTLRQKLIQAPIKWIQFASYAHSIASALNHLHSSTPTKPCVVHRDINSNNVLITFSGRAKLADLGAAHIVQKQQHQPSRITEAGTLRYLSPEALEGAVDLVGARSALCAVDVYALGLVLWELLWRCSDAHSPAPCPPHRPPYHARTPVTLHYMQNLVSRNKVRPPLPKGTLATDMRILKIASDTCEECWDHDAEARLTAVCVEERMAEIKQMLQMQGPVIHDNNLHPHPPDTQPGQQTQEPDKISNLTSAQTCDITTPLLYPHPHIGRNACIERNTLTTQTHTVELIHKSLKDITVQNDAPRVQNIENCLSMARTNPTRVQTIDFENSDRLNEIRSYQRPLDYVQNDVSNHDSERGPKQTNLLQDVKIEKPKWGIKKFFERKLNKNSKVLETEVKLIPDLGNGSNRVNGKIKTSIVSEKPSNVNFDRPANLVLSDARLQYSFEAPCTLSPPNRTLSPTMMLESEMNKPDKVFKELPREENEGNRNQIFAVIVPKAKPVLIKGSSESLNKSVRTSMSSQSFFKSQSESEDSTLKKRLSCDNRILSNASNSGRSSRASINLELQYIDNNQTEFNNSFDLNSDCSSSEDEHLMLLSENGGSKITMQTIPRSVETERKRYHNEVLKETSQSKVFNKNQNKYTNFDNEFSDPNDKENVNSYTVDNPVYLAALKGEIDTDIKVEAPKSPKPPLKGLTIKRQHSLEQVSEIFSSSSDIHLQNPAGRVKTPGDLPVAIRRARRDRALQKGRANESNRLSLYDDRMMFGNSL